VAKHAAVIDGFFKRPSERAATSVHRRAERSQALMRNLVDRPKRLAGNLSTKISDIAAKPSRPAPEPTTTSSPRLDQVDRNKLSRARAISRHQLVQRFGRPRRAPSPTSTTQVLRPAVRPVSTASRQTQPATLAKPLPSMVTSASHYQLERLLDWALVHADAHKQNLAESTRPHRRLWQRIGQWPRTLSIGLPVLLILLVAAWLVYLRVPTLAIKLADWRAGVSASVPAYLPSGFHISGAPAASGGQVNLNYRSGADDLNYQISQRASSWTSATLLANYVKASGQAYQMTEASGKTIYTYGSTDATWVDHGIWYIITNHAGLNGGQITKIATSF